MIAARCLDCGRPFQRRPGEEWKRRCYGCWLAAKGAGKLTAMPTPDPIRTELRDRMRALLMLAHPDRHDGSKLATNTTTWLLSVRDRIEVSP